MWTFICELTKKEIKDKIDYVHKNNKWFEKEVLNGKR